MEQLMPKHLRPEPKQLRSARKRRKRRKWSSGKLPGGWPGISPSGWSVATTCATPAGRSSLIWVGGWLRSRPASGRWWPVRRTAMEKQPKPSGTLRLAQEFEWFIEWAAEPFFEPDGDE